MKIHNLRYFKAANDKWTREKVYLFEFNNLDPIMAYEKIPKGYPGGDNEPGYRFHILSNPGEVAKGILKWPKDFIEYNKEL